MNAQTRSSADYLALLRHSFEEAKGWGNEDSTPLTYLSENIFDFTTYDSEMDEMFAKKAVEVCAAINDGKTFDYIADKENYKWYLLMCNMPFFAGRLEWGTSIRGAWWDHGKHTISSCGLWCDDRQLVEPLVFEREQWREFIAAIVEFARPNERMAECGTTE